MNYNVTHITRYIYGATVELTTGVLRLKPARATVRSSNASASRPIRLACRRLNGSTHSASGAKPRIEKPHRELTMEAASRVRVNEIASLRCRPHGNGSPPRR